MHVLVLSHDVMRQDLVILAVVMTTTENGLVSSMIDVEPHVIHVG